MSKIVKISYNADFLKTTITVDGKEFDTSRIDGREIEDWVYPFQIRKVKWNGIFNELADFIGSDNYNVTFSGKDEDINFLKEECPKTVNIEKDSNASSESAEELENQAKQLDSEEKYEESFKLRMKAADMGYILSIKSIGWHYATGNGIEQNDLEAAKWWKKAAEQGNDIAQYNLGNCYYNGKGVEQNYIEAVKWYRKAAEQGNQYAQTTLGGCYRDGEGVEQNYIEAVKWYRKAAEQGYAFAQYYLAFCYRFGKGVEQNYAEAVKWYRKAAEQGYKYAQKSLGDCYRDGEGVEQNYAEAAKWYQKAAEQGDGEAKKKLQELNPSGSAVKSKGFLSKAADFIKSDKGQAILDTIGTFGGAFVQGYSQASQQYNNDEYYYDDDDDDYDEY